MYKGITKYIKACNSLKSGLLSIQAILIRVYPMLVLTPHASFWPIGGGGFFWKKFESRFFLFEIHFSPAQCDDSELNFSLITEL
jgi:hypothetical protein